MSRKYLRNVNAWVVTNFVLSGAVKEPKPNANVYKVKKVNAKDKALKLANVFGFSVLNEKQIDDKYTVSRDEKSVMVSENGGGFVFYNDVQMIKEGDVPSQEESVKIAQDYLEKLGLFYLGMKATGVEEEVVDYSDKRKVIQNRNVYFQHKLDDILISSGVTRVQIGKNGVIEVVSENKKELEKVGEYPIISMSEAIEAAKSGNAVYAGDKSVADTGYITNVDLVYLDNGPFSSTYTQYHPVYLITGKLDSLDSKDNFKVQVRALKSSVLDNQPNVIAKEPITKKEFPFKKPDKMKLLNPNVTEKDVLVTSEIESAIKSILHENNGNIEGYGDIEEFKYKMNDLFGSATMIDLEYNEPSSISLQFGKSEKATTMKNKDIAKDKYGNIVMNTKKVIIPIEKGKKNDKVILFGDDKGFMVKLDSSNDIDKLMNLIP